MYSIYIPMYIYICIYKYIYIYICTHVHRVIKWPCHDIWHQHPMMLDLPENEADHGKRPLNDGEMMKCSGTRISDKPMYLGSRMQ